MPTQPACHRCHNAPLLHCSCYRTKLSGTQSNAAVQHNTRAEVVCQVVLATPCLGAGGSRSLSPQSTKGRAQALHSLLSLLLARIHTKRLRQQCSKREVNAIIKRHTRSYAKEPEWAHWQVSMPAGSHTPYKAGEQCPGMYTPSPAGLSLDVCPQHPLLTKNRHQLTCYKKDRQGAGGSSTPSTAPWPPHGYKWPAQHPLLVCLCQVA